MVPIHAERGNRLCRDERGRPRLGNGVLVLDAPAELVIVSHGEPMRSRFFPSHGSLVTRVPYERLTSFAVSPPPRRAGRRSTSSRCGQAARRSRSGSSTARTPSRQRCDARGVQQVDPGSPAIDGGNTDLR